MKPSPFVVLFVTSTAASYSFAAPVEIAYDMVNSGSLNLISYTNAYEYAFSSTGDGFQKYRRGLSSSIPFAVLDDSLLSYPSDTLGIVDDNNLNQFFGMVDTVNSDNPSGNVTASWSFNISGASNISIAIDMGAMGDFEATDQFTWLASIDGGPLQTLFAATTDETLSQTYILAGGSNITLNDPMQVNGVVLTNQLQTFTTNVTGSGNVLTLTLEGATDGGSEAFAFQNIKVLASNGAPPPPQLPISLIHEIQGDGLVSPKAGEQVLVEAIVVGDFQNNGVNDNGDLLGFYLQEEDSDVDNNSATSEGIFVYYNGNVDVMVGDKVQVSGLVKEYFSLTEIEAASVTVLSQGEPLPVPTELSLPISHSDAFEAVEGMLVTFPQALVISEYYNFDRYGEIVLAQPLAGENRPMTGTAMEQPGSAAYYTRVEANALSRILLDDGRTSQNPDPAYHPNGAEFTLDNRFRGGDWVQFAQGVMDYRYGSYRLQPTLGANYIAANPRPDIPPYVGGRLKVASFNVLNYFTTLDQNGNLCGPAQNMGCRGADNLVEFNRQRDKIINAIATLDADIVGLIEIENNAQASIDDLVTGLNERLGSNQYAALHTGTIGTDAIKVGFIYQPGSITTAGSFAILDSSVDSRFIDDKNRPALAQTFTEIASGSQFTVAVNHFKSKGSPCDSLGDPDMNDGQGNCNATRTAAAQALADWLASNPTGTGSDNVLIIGDLNAYDKEDPITTLTSSGYQDLLNFYQGESAYTYVFDGQFGYLDYALANNTLSGQITGVAPWHINADEPDILDYDTSFKKDAQDALYDTTPFRSSDHDPVIIGLDLNSPPVCSSAFGQITTEQPYKYGALNAVISGVYDPDGDNVSISIDSVNRQLPFDGQSKNSLPLSAEINEGGLIKLNIGQAIVGLSEQQSFEVTFTASANGGKCNGKVTIGYNQPKNMK